ncbi:MAG: ergothioneine biosynthesis protein EgtB [Betaproteobacteria bacterium]|nr:ergothioneine biosynthesis protein EgtB [Betaproteobacteria bacterium]
MTEPALPGEGAEAHAARHGGAEALARALAASRRDTLDTFAAYEKARPDLVVPLRAELNPPLWELGHIGWFQEYWIERNPARADGVRADPDVVRHPPLRAGADALYHSGRVAHDSRWTLPLPDAAATRADLAAQLAQSLRLLERTPDDDDALYFHRLSLMHEDMHHEAALYMAQGLGIAIADPRWQPRPLPEPAAELAFDAGTWTLGCGEGTTARGFVFDNEVGRADVPTAAYRIDAQVARWADVLPFVEAGGYHERRWWSDAGWAWRRTHPAPWPRYLRPKSGASSGASGGWQRLRHGRWAALDPRDAACHLTLHEAEAWCRWAGRRLPTEAEWERAAFTGGAAFGWGAVWEWTASPFTPFSGFTPHPYRDYSALWFDGRPVLRGASFMTQPRMRHPRYRNFFPAHRSDVPAGFRSCAL